MSRSAKWTAWTVLAATAALFSTAALGDDDSQTSNRSLTTRSQILEVTSNAMNGKFPFFVDKTADAALVALAYKGLDGSDKQLGLSALNNVNSDDRELGVMILEMDGRKIIYLKGHGIHASAGGRITMSYLANGITNNYDQFEMNIANENGRWVLRTVNGAQLITGMFLKKGMVGLKAPKLYNVAFTD
jgi:hypothetical protein